MVKIGLANELTTVNEEIVQHSPLFFDLSELGLIKVSGSDAKKLLQGQLTCDIEKITETEGSMAAHCNPQGRLISLFYVFLQEGAYFLLLPQNMLTISLPALKKYAVFFKVEISIVSDTLTKMGHAGPLPEEIDGLSLIKMPAVSRHIFIGKKEQMSVFSKEQMKSLHDWHALNIKDCIPTLYPETSGKFLPHELNLPKLHVVDFEKGCYTGQEIIARMHYRGKLKNALYKANIFTRLPLLPGADIYAMENQQTRASGIMVDVYQKELHHYAALLITDEAHAKEQSLFLDPRSCSTKENFFVFTP